MIDASRIKPWTFEAAYSQQVESAASNATRQRTTQEISHVRIAQAAALVDLQLPRAAVRRDQIDTDLLEAVIQFITLR